MMLTIDVAKQCEIFSFAMVHDSYGTHAADAETMWWCLRKAFVEMYSQTDVLEDFRTDLLDILPKDKHDSISEAPPKGSLDIAKVEDSEFFFN